MAFIVLKYDLVDVCNITKWCSHYIPTYHIYLMLCSRKLRKCGCSFVKKKLHSSLNFRYWEGRYRYVSEWIHQIHCHKQFIYETWERPSINIMFRFVQAHPPQIFNALLSQPSVGLHSRLRPGTWWKFGTFSLSPRWAGNHVQFILTRNFGNCTLHGQ